MTGLPVIPVLNDDVLGYVFHLNTHTPELEGGFSDGQGKKVSALNTARHTSQVCHSWRELILGSPTIWANIIDLEMLSNASLYWVKEVIKRTGNVNLSIYGPVGHTPKSRWLITFLLKDPEYWCRLRRLDINVKKAGLLDEFFWSIFWTRPAPNLETFIVTGFIHDKVTQCFRKIDGSQLFSGSAPSLHRMHCLHNFHFDHCATWISQLLSITLSRPVRTVDALNVIAATPFLESLVIQRTLDDNDAATNWSREIHLPNLHRLFVSSDIVGSYVYLSKIVPSDDCALILAIRDETNNLNHIDNLHDLSNMISPYAKRYFNAHFPTILAINMEEISIRFTYKTDAEVAYFGYPEFSLNLRSKVQNQIIAPRVVDSLLSTLAVATANCNTVTSLRFALSHSTWFMLVNTWFMQVHKPLHFFRLMTSVKTISVTPWALHVLDDILDPAPLFPGLTEVAIRHHEWDQNFNFKKRLFRYLRRRKHAGVPVQVLNIAHYSPLRNLDISGFLQECEGLDLLEVIHGRLDSRDDSDEE